MLEIPAQGGDDDSAMIPKRQHKEENHESWLMSYADMITLLLAFFVIFVSTSEPKRERLKAATEGMRERFGIMNLDSPYDGLYRDVQGIVQSRNAERIIAVDKLPRGIQVELAATRFFQPGSADIPASALPALQEIIAAVKSGELRDYEVIAEGHTDDSAPSGQYKTNWELSAARAARVADAFAAGGVAPERLRVIAYGEMQPAVPNRDALGKPIEENRSKNSRVVVRVERIKRL